MRVCARRLEVEMGEAKRRRDRGEDWTQRPGYQAERLKELAIQEAEERRRILREKESGHRMRRAVARIPLVSEIGTPCVRTCRGGRK
jgi:hypothetical protein